MNWTVQLRLSTHLDRKDEDFFVLSIEAAVNINSFK
jgi:hypothetical protein